MDAQCKLDTDKEIIESQAKDLHRLITGLEALAGEWERVVKQMGGHDTPHTDAAVLTCVRELRTLANSAKGGA